MDLGATICRPRAPDCPACPLNAGLRAPSRAASPEPFPRRSAKTRAAAAPRHCLLDRARRLRLAGPPPGQGHARRNGGAARTRMDATSPQPRDRRSVDVTPCLHPFRARPGRRWPRPSPSARAGGSRSTGSPKPACRPSTAERPSRSCSARSAACRLSPSSPAPGLDRADQLRVEPERDSPSWPATRRAPAASGATAFRQSTRMGRLEWQHASAHRPVPRPQDGAAAILRRRAAASPTCACRLRTLGVARPETTRRLFAAALSLANWHSPPPFLRQLRPASTGSIRGGWSRRCRLRRRAFPARRPGRDHACRA